jgi:thiol:disulfide interchange protein
MWSLILTALLTATPAPVADSPTVWTIAADGSMVELWPGPVEVVPEEEEADKKVKESPQQQDIRVVAFTATWCAACSEVKSIVREMQERSYPIELADADEPKNRATLRKYRIEQLPAYIIYYRDKPVEYCEGPRSRAALVDWISDEQIKRAKSGPLTNPEDARFFREKHWVLSRGTCGMLGCSIHGGGWVLR